MSLFNEILRLRPQLDRGQLNNMQRQLNTRFGNVAKRFGSGLKTAFMGFAKGALIAGAVTAITRLLNPIREVDDAISNILDKADNIATRARQFGVEAGKYFKISQLAEASDLQQAQLDQMISRFQVELERSRETGTGALAGFTGESDVISAFYRFMQAAQRLSEDERAKLYSDIFGERPSGRAAEFLMQDFQRLQKDLRLRPFTEYTSEINRLAALQDREAIYRTIRERDERFFGVGGQITHDMLRQRDVAERQRIREVDLQAQMYDEMQALNLATGEIKQYVQSGFFNLINEFRKTYRIIEYDRNRREKGQDRVNKNMENLRLGGF